MRNQWSLCFSWWSSVIRDTRRAYSCRGLLVFSLFDVYETCTFFVLSHMAQAHVVRGRRGDVRNTRKAGEARHHFLLLLPAAAAAAAASSAFAASTRLRCASRRSFFACFTAAACESSIAASSA
jgi:hypothetical protein